MKRNIGRFTTITLVLMLMFTSIFSMKVDPVRAEDANASPRVDEAWRRFRSGDKNNNGNNPSLLKSDNTGANVLENGSFAMTLKTKSTKSDTRFGVYLRYKDANNFVYVGMDASSNWFYEYKVNGSGVYPKLNVPAPEQGEIGKLELDWSGKNLNVKINGAVTNGGNPIVIDALETLKDAPFRLRAGTWGTVLTDVLFKDVVIKDGTGTSLASGGNDVWSLSDTSASALYEENYTEPVIHEVQVSGVVKDDKGALIEGANVNLATNHVKTNASGAFAFSSVPTGEYKLSVSKSGYKSATKDVKVVDEDINLGDITLEKEDEISVVAPAEIASSKMTVGIDDKFPRVLLYTMKGGEVDGRKFYGQTEILDVVKINGVEVKPTVEFSKEASKAKYVMTLKDAANDIDAVLTSELIVKGNTLEFKITDIKDNKIVKTIEIPGHNLVSVRDTQANAAFAGATMSTNTHVNGDVFESVGNLANGKKGYMYSFVSTSGLSAGLWSNSENNVSADWQRVTSEVKTYPTYKSVGLSSTFWTFQKSAAHRKENKVDELPSTKVILAGDINEDANVDWQDGAVAYRDIMQVPLGAELVPDRVAIRVAMNFGSQAQNPFLVTLDNVKKVNLSTDGLGQSVLLKGYGSEGHDSGHLNYADIGTRIGGAEDMKALLKAGKDYGATFGVHVNASETYPESKYFEEARLKKNTNGTWAYGWNWLDQGINIDADYDLRNGRAERFKDFYDALGGAVNDLDFIYVDVWGNGQSGDNGTWASRQLSKEITDLGWRVASEWGHANEYDSTFQHWAADLTYGGYKNKGINSKITRFIRNHEKDAWVGDYIQYGGAANNPLLGGYDMKDFEGWQGRNDYDGYIKNLFDDDVSTKFVQHFKVTNWQDGTAVQMSDNSENYTWVPEMKVTLQDDEKTHKLEIERQSNDVNAAGYRLRTMMFDGKKIMDGETYLIPWYWDENGKELSSGNQKLYHWNQKGGKTTWEVPSGWSGSVKVYKLTELGKTKEQTVAIAGGKVELNAEAETAYVLYKGPKTNATMTWSDGMHVKDTGFNSGSLADWSIKGESAKANIVKSEASNDMLAIADNTNVVSLSQKVEGLKAGKTYAAYVGVDNRSDVNAYIEVKVDGKVISNYTKRSIAKNYISAYAHNNSNGTIEKSSYFQNMYVFFTAPSDGSEVTFTLKRDAGAGTTYFDDIRIFENKAKNQVEENKFVQDFEEVPQGIYPFVVGGVEGVSDNRTHLSELNAPYTQRGWNEKKIDDVIEGTWSVKSNGLTARNKLVYQTIPQNFRFEPGVTYNVTFKYETGTTGAYGFVQGDGEVKANPSFAPFEETISKDGARTYKVRVTGAASGQTWIGIYSTSTPADTQGNIGGDADFRGFKDFMLDDLAIEKSIAQKAVLEKLVDENKGRFEVNYSPNSWTIFKKAMDEANAVLDDFEATQAIVDASKNKLEQAINKLEVVGGVVKGVVKDAQGKTLSNIDIEIFLSGTSITTKTSNNGSYSIPGVLFGERTLKADSPYFKTVEEKVKVSATVPEVIKDITMEKVTTSTKGKITAVGKPVEGAAIVITAGTTRFETQSDVNGNYTISDIPSDVYMILVTKSGYDISSSSLEATKYGEAVKNVMLEPQSGADYFNDFENGIKTWDNLAGNTSSTTISMENGMTNIKFPGGHANVYDTAAPVFKNGIVEMELIAKSNAPRVGLILRANDMSNRVYVGTLETSNMWFTEHWGSGGNAWSGGSAGPAFKAGEKIHLKAEIVEKTITLWVNGEKVLENTMNALDVKAGVVGLNTRTVNEVAVNSVKVTSYDPPAGEVQVVAGHVSNHGLPFEGATIQLTSDTTRLIDKTVKSDLNGNYKFKNIPFGNYTATISIPGETNIVKKVKVEAVDGYIVVGEARFNPLTLEPVDKTSLTVAIEDARSKVQADYTNASWLVFEEALKHAEAILADSDATQESVSDAEADLMLAQTQLMEPTKTELSAQISIARRKVETDYTVKSWKVFARSLSEAEVVNAKAKPSEKELTAAITNLVKGMNQLEYKAIVPTEPEKTLPTSNASKGSVRSGDETNVGQYLWIGAIMLSVLVGITYKKKKKE